MERVPDHPIIKNMELSGYPDGKAPQEPICPVCSSECETIYRDQDGEIFGCENCVKEIDAWDTPECFPDKE